MRIEFQKGLEQDLTVDKFKEHKEIYRNYLEVSKIAGNKPRSFKTIIGYEVVYDYSLN